MGQGFLQISLTLCIVVAIVPVLGRYMALVFSGERTLLDPLMNPIDRSFFVLTGVANKDDMTGWEYIRAVMYSNICMSILVYTLIFFQRLLPWNPNGFDAPTWDILLHTVVSFVTNTGQEHYTGEITLSYFSQVAALGFLMFTSAATGLAVGIAFIRGLTGKKLGNFYVDLTRAITRILLPISVIGAMALVFCGVPQTLDGTLVVQTLEGRTQYIARGPVASFEMIKMLGDNGGGFFGVNSAHPFENPNGAANLMEIIAMIAIPASLIYTYGIFVKNIKQAWLIFWMIFVVFVILTWLAISAEQQGNPLVNSILESQEPNLEGKEIRLGVIQTALWAVITTATMCGAVNGMQDSLMPQGLFSTLFNLFLRIIWGDQGTGTAYLFIYLILGVFLTGLMVGRTPEFLGRKIERPEIILTSVVLLIHPIVVLIPTAIALAYPNSLSGITNPGFHGISQVVYEYASASANNASSLQGLDNNTLWWNLSTCFSMLAGRYIPVTGILLLAHSMSRKPTIPQTPSNLKTDSLLFTIATAGLVVILGMLAFFPVLALGPIAEGFKLASGS
ncbi:potassium-transporting ATPase subunit KdpA [Umezakia ovalisporum]|jgi:K+-transporting ATPase ATPase A chain|uniref:Potassium-transporting ATPase potassium-binding subunit n=2 Tax=Umezakia ovalisporum TaxID=75695 RepID=A0AA43H088_9CYAN|nr:potassium-transporting ATPase subunit KdpA [Umezakia ovalisporum]MBI1242475.1 potassium-transporting ATPase subunit A [Nostoc sp. RI_552]MDH6057453.1 potassium-transporting ATPase subunit KdpA [Umezakia ovalisporum FSS-43]MDH6064250.1 potassium-transporting ATPase subunit KdpA [Umezakia ovalisporum FSS-62]MDH6066800.1 potassium-transporting ATPase subunit KdpA [Umezakia ovalisporum APH033B]MDH6070843.1 potassium-transporting ATPase subunit KdpA [Umezakia ovalisporum CobakiLakeA]